MKIPTLFKNIVFHIGTMQPQNKKLESFEGGGLSVSTEPSAWEKIAQLGGLPWWELTKPTGQFLNALKISTLLQEQIQEWGVEQHYLEISPLYRVTWWDDEWGTDFSQLFLSPVEAALEAKYYDTEVQEELGFISTPLLEVRTGVKCSLSEVGDHLLTIWAEEETDLDGIWWNEKLDVSFLSAPRGVILPTKLKEWKVELFR